MARSTQHEWFSFRRVFSRRASQLRSTTRQPLRRRLRFEPLEDRRLLALVTVTTLGDTVDFGDGVTSLREAIFATNLVAGADTIEFAASLTSAGAATLTLTQGELAISDSLAINGPGANLLTIDASGNDPTPGEYFGDGSRVFNINDGNDANVLDVSISGLTLTGGDVTGSGGAISSSENMTVTDSTISGNSGSHNGGGIYAGNLTLTGSTISGNSAGNSGGGISGGDVTVTNSTISGNSAGFHGGGIYAGNFTVTDSTISGNSARFSGGGIFSRYNTLTVTNSTISGNSADQGGGIATFFGHLMLTSSTISGNSARAGGGIFSSYGNLTVTGSTISGNSATNGGGGGILSSSISNLTVSDSTISYNSAGYGGGIYCSGGNLGGNSTVIRSTISGNSATSGGGILSSSISNLTVSDSTISYNSAGRGGGIFSSGGNLAVIRSTIGGNSALTNTGGGIEISGSILPRVVTITDSTISGNSATSGGGIWSNVTVTVTGSTISGNSATSGGGGIRTHGLSAMSISVITSSTISDNVAGVHGGGISESGFGSLLVTNTTISGNSAGVDGGGIRKVALGVLTLTNSTIFANQADADNNGTGRGGGITGPAVLNHTIVAGNTLGNGLRDDLFGTGAFSTTFSLIGDNTGATITDNGGNLIGTAGAPIDPLLGPLADNGGPTFANALLAGSPAIDAGDPSIVFNPAEHDQRGAPFVRVFDGDGAGGARIDIGAYERQSVAGLNLVVDTAADEHDADYSAGDLSLREAIDLAHGFVGADTITFAAALSGATLTLTQGELAISEALVIDARPLAANVTIDANELSRIFNITATTGDFTISGLTLTGGRTTANLERGGAINSLTAGNLTIDQSTVSGNSTVGHGHGGGIYAYRNLTLTNSTVSGNSTAGRYAGGGGIFAMANVTLTNSTVSGNSTAGEVGNGGGIYANGNVTLTNSTVSVNGTTGEVAYGGGIFAMANVTLTNSTVSGNSTVGLVAHGGGISARGGNITLTNSTVSGNFTTGDSARGGGIFAWDNVALTNSTVSGNRTTGRYADGGGIFADYGVTLTNSTVSGNSTVGYRADGGGIHADGNVTLNNSTVSGNTTTGDFARGGGIFARANFGPYASIFPGNLTLTNSTVSGNSTAGDFANGGGIFALEDSVTLTNSTVSGNTTTGDFADGGGIYIYATYEPVIVINSIVAGNTASGGNPDLRPENGALTVDYSLIGDTSGLSAGQLAAINSGTGNILNQNALLDSLADNGGPTMTHALLAGSPAIDAGDPAAIPGFMNVPLYDQRGAPFTRANGSRIDFGAVERQPIPSAVFGDYSQNGEVDAADYSVWRNTLGSSVAAYDGADGDGDGTIDQDDYGVWRAHFGQSVPSAGAGSGFAEASSVESQELRAEALSMLRIAADHVGEPVQLPTLPTSAPTDTEAATARAASFALLETRSLWQDLSSPSRGRLHRYSVAESGADDLSLLLAIDRVWLSRRRDPFVSDDSVNDEHRVNDDHSRSLIDQALAARCRPTHVRLRR